jgi:hypothetical protein
MNPWRFTQYSRLPYPRIRYPVPPTVMRSMRSVG